MNDRWHYEVEEIARIMLSDDHEASRKLLDKVLANISVIETARIEAGIIFPGDEQDNRH